MAIIEVDHVTKEYRLGAIQGLKQAVFNVGARIVGKPLIERPLFKALDDVSFNIEQGEVVGIIGHNGAGKSTLLKLLARISTPTAGMISVNGRVAPLIEVGAGFVPDFTGRENVYLNGAILGMSKAEIDKKFDEIVEFSEISEFIDTPVKRFSSGMQVKLAFAVATSIESEVLIVDEVLAVGDIAFQRKCFDRMEDLIRRQHRTVLLVSHNIRQVERLCSRVILLRHGQMVADGNPRDVCNLFFEENDRKIQAQLSKERASGKSQNKISDGVELIGAQFQSTDGNELDFVHHGQDVVILLHYRSRLPLERLTFGLGIHTPDLLYLASRDTGAQYRSIRLTNETFCVSCAIRNFPFLPGSYALRVSIAQGDAMVFYAENVHPFIVTSRTGSRSDMSEEGFIRLDTNWSLPDANGRDSTSQSLTHTSSQ